MTEFKSTSQYTVEFKGSSSKPFVQEPPVINEENPNHVDLHLGGPTLFSDNLEDYTAYHEGIELNTIKIKGNVLTVQP